MPWLQISIHTDKNNSETAEQLLLALGALSVSLSDAADEPILEPAPGETPVWNNTIVTALFESSHDQQNLIEQLQASLKDAQPAISAATLEDQDWSRAWMEHYQPMQFGERLWVCPWHIEPPQPDATNLRLDPGLAFGTGTHPTTSLCLRWLDKHCHGQKTLLDYGCGSGILAIAALLLGVERAAGVDIDPQALEASVLNADANDVADRLSLYTVDQFSSGNKVSNSYDIVMANILSGPLVELAGTLAGFSRPGGDLVLSGILREQADSVLNAYRDFFDMDTPVIEGDWVMLHACRKN